MKRNRTWGPLIVDGGPRLTSGSAAISASTLCRIRQDSSLRIQAPLSGTGPRSRWSLAKVELISVSLSTTEKSPAQAIWHAGAIFTQAVIPARGEFWLQLRPVLLPYVHSPGPDDKYGAHQCVLWQPDQPGPGTHWREDPKP